MKRKKLLRPCPICSSSQGEELGRLSFSLFDDCPMSREFDVVACNECSFVFFDTPDTTEMFSTFYKEHYFSSAYVSAEKLTDEIEPVISIENDPLSIIDNHLDYEARICELGCGKGSLLSKFKDAGYKNLYGVEPSAECVKYIQNRYNIPAVVGTVEDIPTFEEKFDSVISTHVFEHVLDLTIAVKNITRILNDGGMVYIEVPDLKRYDFHKNMNPLDYITIYEHINHFTISSLCNLFERNGFSMIECGEKMLSEKTRLPLPAIYGLFTKEKAEPTNSVKTENIDIRKIKEWLEHGKFSKDGELKEVAQKGTDTYIWGINLFVQKMMSMSPLKKCNIIAMIDKDKDKQKKTIGGNKIEAPEILRKAKDDAVVVVWGGPYRMSIEKDIKTMGYNGKVLVI